MHPRALYRYSEEIFSEKCGEFLFKYYCGNAAYHPVYDFSITDEDEARDAHDPVGSCGLWVFINVQLANSDFSIEFFRKFFDHRSHHLTWTAPVL